MHADLTFTIVIGSTLKGLVTGRVAGLVARWRRSMPLGVCAGLLVGFLMLATALPHAVPGVSAQAPAAVDALAPVARLVGRWTGTSEGQPGRGTVERQYERVLGSRFIQVRNRSTYPPQDKNPKGETHEDIGFLSFDSGRQRLVFRQFHVEGFVNQYVLEPGATADRLVFTSESIENIPAGYRARETYVFSGPDQLEEIFEIAEPGKDFAPYSRSRLTRAR